jgi:hypothetical protein
MKANKFTQLYNYVKVFVTGKSTLGAGEVGEVHIR